jgi:hypothetical protein
VNQVTEDRQGSGVGVLERQRDRIANAEAHAEVCRAKDTHGVVTDHWCRLETS